MSVPAYDDEADRLAAYHALIRGVARRQGLRGEADDIAQETIARFLKHAARLDLARDPVPWLLRVAHNLCMDVHRGRVRVVATDDTEAMPAGTAPSPLDGVLLAERAAELRDALARLSPRDRELLQLRYVDDLPYDVLAQRFGRPGNTLRQHVYRAKRRLLELVGDGIEQWRSFVFVTFPQWRTRRSDAVAVQLPAAAASIATQLVVPVAVVAQLLGGPAAEAPAAPAARSAGRPAATPTGRLDAPPPGDVVDQRPGAVRPARPAPRRPDPTPPPQAVEVEFGDEATGVNGTVEDSPDNPDRKWAKDWWVEVAAAGKRYRVDGYYRRGPDQQPPWCEAIRCLPDS